MARDDKKDGHAKEGLPARNGWYARLRRFIYPAAVVTSVTMGAGAVELKTSRLQSRALRDIAGGKSFTETKKTGPGAMPPAEGPYDERLGYARADALREALDGKGYVLSGGAETWQDRKILGVHLFPIYNEKAQAGLEITDDAQAVLAAAKFPRRVYPDFDSIPPLLVNSLLFVENRELLAGHPETWNPAVEWSRFGKAVAARGLKKLGRTSERAGGSTLATQIEKFRHSKDGITSAPSDKLRQMLTASVRAYRNGGDTRPERRRIVLDYLNAMPLSSYPGFGEVNGFADGMTTWFGAGFDDVNRQLRQPQDALGDAELARIAKTYRESLTLVMAVKKPSAYLLKDRQELQDRIDRFLPLMAKAGVISPRFRDMALAARVAFAEPGGRAKQAPRGKAATALEVELMRATGVGDLYALNRLDLAAKTTVDAAADAAVSKILRGLTDPATAAAAGLTGFRLLKSPEDAAGIAYSFSLYEKTAAGNVLRVQTDNFDGQLNLNEGVKLELGSTAKLRTLVSYLEAVSDLHARHAGAPKEALRAVRTAPADHITRWALDYLAASPGASLEEMLEASLERKYSGSPGESFFTGGGLHRFENFERKEDGQSYNVKDAFHHSVNLSFIRIMRDVVNYTLSQKMHVDAAIYEDPAAPARRAYLEKFADAEGTGFLWKFWGEQKGKNADETASLLAAKTRRAPVQLAVVYRALYPEAPLEGMEAFIRREAKDVPARTDFQKLYDAYGPGKFDLNDQAYITHTHPLELWLAAYKAKTPGATWEAAAASASGARQDAYKWLFKPDKIRAQNTRIGTMLEKEAFAHIRDDWAATGFPFAAMVPSYASALGASGDTPAALAQLSGILQNDGVLKPAIKFREIDFARGTPYEMDFRPRENPGTRVLPPEVAKIVRREMQGVVREGTARKAYNAVTLSDGRSLPVGGKTGTGDNRLQTFSAKGAVTSSDAKSRTATFVYAIDDRFYGCVTAYVMGPQAGRYSFTSALAAQVFRTVAPVLRPVLDRAYGVGPGPVKKAERAGGPPKQAL